MQNEKDSTTNATWNAITGSGATTASYTVTCLDNLKEYDFKVRAIIGSDATLVNGVESNKATVNVADQTPSLSSTITDQALTQSAEYTSATAFPAATGGDAPFEYSVDNLPTGITLNAERKLTGTHTATNSDITEPDSATLTFNISVAPKKPVNFTATAGDARVTLRWTTIAGVTGWQFKQDSGGWTTIVFSDATATSHTIAGLASGRQHTFQVRAYVGTGDVRVNGIESDAKSATTFADRVPALTDMADLFYVQDTEVDETLPAVTGGDGHPNYIYTLTPEVSNIGLTFDPSTRNLSGTATGMGIYNYRAMESDDPDGGPEWVSKTFNISIQPKKPENFSATAGDRQVTLSLGGQQQHPRPGVPAGRRRVDSHSGQRWQHEQSHRDRPRQRHGVQLQGALLRRGGGYAGEWRGVRCQVGDDD